MDKIEYLSFSHLDILSMDDIFRYLVNYYKPKGLKPFIGGYSCTSYGNSIAHDYRVTVILIEE
jgi:hypothetical protein